MKSKSLAIGVVLIVSALVISSCGPAAVEPTPMPTAASTEPPVEEPTAPPTESSVAIAGPSEALDAALAYFGQNHPDQAPTPDLDWTEENVTEEGLVGASTFRYTAGDWTVTVSFPVVAPDATIYAVAVVDQATGFQWEGEVDASGRVTELAVVEGPDVLFQGISFSYDAAVADDVLAETVPAIGPAGPDVPEWEVEPEHLRFSFVGYTLPDTFHEPRIAVYPVGEFEATSEMAARVIATLRQTLADRPAVPEALPILPPFNAGPLMRTQFAYLDFQTGSGVRFLTQYAQAYIPINNHELFYAFQGLTEDGQWYVAAILPVSHPSLPPDGTEIPGDDFEAFAEDFEAYAAQIEEQLNAENAASFTPDLSLLDAMISSLEVAREAPTTAGQPVACWYGRIESTPADAAIDDYLVLLPEEARRAVDVVGAAPAVEAEIQALRDTGTYAHFWGTLNCRVPNWGGCRLVVTRLRPEGPDGPFFDPDPVEGWSGSVFNTPQDAQFDDYFVQAGGTPMSYGIGSTDPAIAAQLKDLRDAPAIIRVWGQVMCPAIDYQGSMIQVERLEVSMETPAEEGYVGWKPYLNEAFGYSVWVPGECMVMGSNFNDAVQFTAGEWPVLSVSHYSSDFYRPPAGADLVQWVIDHVPSYDAIDTAAQIAGLPAVHLITEATQQSYAFDEYYFEKDGQLFRIQIVHTAGREDWELYTRFLESFRFQ